MNTASLPAAPVVASPLSFKPAVIVVGESKWSYNGLRFATLAEALERAEDLSWRWTAVREWAAHPSEDAPNYALVDGQLVALEVAG